VVSHRIAKLHTEFTEFFCGKLWSRVLTDRISHCQRLARLIKQSLQLIVRDAVEMSDVEVPSAVSVCVDVVEVLSAVSVCV